MRVKTHWFKREQDSVAPEENATVVASTIWRLADKAVNNLSKADYDIINPQRGFGIIAELTAFMLHMADRMTSRRLADADRAAFVQTAGRRLAEIMEQNIHDVVGDRDHPYQAGFIDLLNRRMNDYAGFELDAGKPSFAMLRYLGNALRERLEKRDQPWVVDQIMELEAPEFMETLVKTVNGLFGAVPEGGA